MADCKNHANRFNCFRNRAVFLLNINRKSIREHPPAFAKATASKPDPTSSLSAGSSNGEFVKKNFQFIIMVLPKRK
jgi:hypothetical protein